MTVNYEQVLLAMLLAPYRHGSPVFRHNSHTTGLGPWTIDDHFSPSPLYADAQTAVDMYAVRLVDDGLLDKVMYSAHTEDLVLTNLGRARAMELEADVLAALVFDEFEGARP